MAVFTRIRKVANPHRRKVAVKRRTRLARNASGQFLRRKKKAKRATVKRKRKTVARRAVRRNPVRRRRTVKAVRRKVVRRKPVRKARKRRNPALLVTLGAVNPQPKRKVKVARRTKKAKKNPVHRRRRSKNATRIVVMAPRRRSSVRRRRSNPKRRMSYRRARRNPSVFGSRLGSGQTFSMIMGGLIGVTAAKVIPTMLPTSLTASPIVRLLVTGASAWAASLAASKVFSGPFADAVFFGGLMQTGSIALNTFVPSIGSRVGLNGGMGDLVPGTFSVPQNPIKGYVPPAPPTTARTTMNGLNRAFSPAF